MDREKAKSNIYNMLMARNADMITHNGKSQINNTDWCKMYRVGNFKTQFLPTETITEQEAIEIAEKLLQVDMLDARRRRIEKELNEIKSFLNSK